MPLYPMILSLGCPLSSLPPRSTETGRAVGREDLLRESTHKTGKGTTAVGHLDPGDHSTGPNGDTVEDRPAGHPTEMETTGAGAAAAVDDHHTASTIMAMRM